MYFDYVAPCTVCTPTNTTTEEPAKAGKRHKNTDKGSKRQKKGEIQL